MGQGLVDEVRGVDWSRAPDESTAESARLDRSGNRYAAWPDETGAEGSRLARQGNAYAYWPDETGAEAARLDRYETKARFLDNAAKVWAVEDAAAAKLALAQQHRGADVYRRELAEARARDRFNFSDGLDARDIRQGFAHQSRLSRALSDQAGAPSFSSAGSLASPGQARVVSAAEGFFVSNAVGRLASGWGSAAADIVKSPYTLAKEVVFTVGDAVGNATYGALNFAFDGNQIYQNDSALLRSVDANGVLGTLGNAITGTVKSLPGIAQIDAIYRRDAYALGASVPVTGLAAMGGLGNVEGLLQTGGRQVLNPNRIEGWDAAERVYSSIRADRSDIALIAQNTGMPEATIARIKMHVFENEHLLDTGLRQFDADPNIVNSWSRLQQGDFLQSDLILLSHERFESKFEALFKTNYRTAHDAAESSGRVWTPE